MSETENIAENPAEHSASGTPTPTPKATPKAKGRGRGRKAAVNKKATAAVAAANVVGATTATSAPGPKKAVGGRRGRTKQFDNDKIQASYERQREIKAYYNDLAASIKPALITMAEREIEAIKTDPDYFMRVPEYKAVRDELKRRYDRQIQFSENRCNLDNAVEEKVNRNKIDALTADFKNNFGDAEDRFLDAQIRRLELLEELYDRGLPVTTVDDQWNYKLITDKEADDFGPYEVWHDGHLIPYPQLVEGTEAYALRQAAHARPPTPEIRRPRVVTKTQPKRRAKEQPEGQPVAKRGTRNTVVDEQEVVPVQHTQGLLSAQPNNAASEDQSGESTPVPDETSGSGPIHPKDREPALPPFASEPDEYGCRVVSRIPTKAEIDKGKVIYNRIIVPAAYELDPIEIGFRDSTNDPTRAATLAKRGKYLGTNGTSYWHFDPMVARHDARFQTEEDLDQELVAKFGLHPRYGVFLPTSRNDAEPPKPLARGDKPVVYITPKGKTIHASRSVNPDKVTKAIGFRDRQKDLAASIAEYSRLNDIDPEEIEPPELKDLREIQAQIAEREQTESAEASERPSVEPSDQPTAFVPANDSVANAFGIAALLEAAASVEPKPAPTPSLVAAAPLLAPRPATTRSYDAIRDMVIEHAPIVQPPPPVSDTFSLSILADVCSDFPPSQPQPSKRPRNEDVLMADAPSKKRPFFPYHGEDPSLRPNGLREDLTGLRGPPSQKRATVGPTIFAVEESSMRTTMAPDGPPRLGLDGPSYHRASFSRPSEPYAEQQPLRPFVHHDLPPVRPLDMNPMRPTYGESPRMQPATIESRPDLDHRVPPPGPQDAYPLSYGRSRASLPPLQTRSVSRMPFSNPHQGQASPSLPPLRPHPQQSFGEPSNGYYGHASRMAPESPYGRSQPPSALPYSAITPSHIAPPPYGGLQNLASPYAPIAPSPAQASPTLIPFAPLAPNTDYGSPARPRTGSNATTPSNGRYRELAPAPLPAHRQGQAQSQELRTVQYVPGENIKDYTPTEQLPARGPQVVRSWNQYSHKSRGGLGGQERRDSH